MSEAVIPLAYNIRRAVVNSPTICGVEGGSAFRHHRNVVLDTDQLLALLEERGVRNVEIARALGLPDSRVPEIKRKERALKLDEAVKLVRAFGLEQAQAAHPLPPAVNRLIVRYIAQELGSSPDDNHLEELTEDLRAFSEFVADPKVRRSLDAAESFFQAMRLRRPKSGSEARRQIDPHRAQ